VKSEQVAGSDWKLSEEGKSAELPEQEPEFSTWDDVMGREGRAASGSAASTSSAQDTPSRQGVRDPLYYRYGFSSRDHVSVYVSVQARASFAAACLDR
jgi:hypothetical protein